MNSDFVFTSESVTEGHPDKLADLIADTILDGILSRDKRARVACEVLTTTGLIFITGQITTDASVNYAKLARETLLEVGYRHCELGIDGRTCSVVTTIEPQSPDIKEGVNRSVEARSGSADPKDALGAGDQGIIYGFACRDTDIISPDILMPLPIYLANRLCLKLAEVRHQDQIDFLRPDGKSQVTVQYREGRPLSVPTVIIAAQHEDSVSDEELREEIVEEIIKSEIPLSLFPGGDIANCEILVNTSGRFVVGGPLADTGMTGRKIVVDSYGGFARVGGGSFSGKDPTKVDRSSSYYLRYAAKNLVAAGVADRLELQVAYSIGRAEPVAKSFDAFCTNHIEPERIKRLLDDRSLFDFRPAAVIEALNLLQTRFRPYSVGGHFGRMELDSPWERLDKVEEIRRVVGKIRQ